MIAEATGITAQVIQQVAARAGSLDWSALELLVACEPFRHEAR
jgi:hypothetical protein